MYPNFIIMNAEKQYKNVAPLKHVIDNVSSGIYFKDKRPQNISQHNLIKNIQCKRNDIVQFWEKAGVNRYLLQNSIGKGTIDSIKRRNIPVVGFSDATNNKRGNYSTEDNKVYLNDILEDDQASSTLVHEIRHAWQFGEPLEAKFLHDYWVGKLRPIVDEYLQVNYPKRKFSDTVKKYLSERMAYEFDAHLHQGRYIKTSIPPIAPKSDELVVGDGEFLEKKLEIYLQKTYLKMWTEQIISKTKGVKFTPVPTKIVAPEEWISPQIE